MFVIASLPDSSEITAKKEASNHQHVHKKFTRTSLLLHELSSFSVGGRNHSSNDKVPHQATQLLEV
jgi:hypothetical protein